MKFWHDQIYYRNYVIKNKHLIPRDKPLIFTPNHQNALMDALALLFSIDIIFVFLARADIFKNKRVAKILYFLKILPIYRVRDGFETVKKSKDILRKAVDIITSGSAMVILPEGNHSRYRRLRPLKKGFARMAFEAEELHDYNLDVHIVPVGIDYDSHSSYRSSLVVNFGEAIAVSEFTELYKENHAIALNKLKQALSVKMAPLIVNITTEEYYETYDEIRHIYRGLMAKKLNMLNNMDNRIELDNIIIKKLDNWKENSIEELNSLNDTVLEFIKLKEQLGLNNQLISKGKHCILVYIVNILYLLAALPVYLFGTLNNFITYFIPIIAASKMKDEQFKSSVKFVLSAILFPISIILQSLLVFIVTNSWAVTAIYTISVPVTGIIAYNWSMVFKKLKKDLKYFFYSLSNNQKFSRLNTLYDKIITIMDRVTM